MPHSDGFETVSRLVSPPRNLGCALLLARRRHEQSSSWPAEPLPSDCRSLIGCITHVRESNDEIIVINRCTLESLIRSFSHEHRRAKPPRDDRVEVPFDLVRQVVL